MKHANTINFQVGQHLPSVVKGNAYLLQSLSLRTIFADSADSESGKV